MVVANAAEANVKRSVHFPRMQPAPWAKVSEDHVSITLFLIIFSESDSKQLWAARLPASSFFSPLQEQSDLIGAL